MNLQFRTFAITDVHTWREDLWDRGWTVRRMRPKRGAFGWKLLLWRKSQVSHATLLRNRFLCVVAWPVLLAFDIGIAACGVDPWKTLRSRSNNTLAKIWSGLP